MKSLFPNQRFMLVPSLPHPVLVVCILECGFTCLSNECFSSVLLNSACTNKCTISACNKYTVTHSLMECLFPDHLLYVRCTGNEASECQTCAWSLILIPHSSCCKNDGQCSNRRVQEIQRHKLLSSKSGAYTVFTRTYAPLFCRLHLATSMGGLIIE